jgi:membrane-associated phospholipid phosphatase
MTVIVGITFYFILSKRVNVPAKILFTILSFLQGFARIYLHYHTFEQVIGGAIFGIIFSLIFLRIFNEIYFKINKKYGQTYFFRLFYNDIQMISK